MDDYSNLTEPQKDFLLRLAEAVQRTGCYLWHLWRAELFCADNRHETIQNVPRDEVFYHSLEKPGFIQTESLSPPPLSPGEAVKMSIMVLQKTLAFAQGSQDESPRQPLTLAKESDLAETFEEPHTESVGDNPPIQPTGPRSATRPHGAIRDRILHELYLAWFLVGGRDSWRDIRDAGAWDEDIFWKVAERLIHHDLIHARTTDTLSIMANGVKYAEEHQIAPRELIEENRRIRHVILRALYMAYEEEGQYATTFFSRLSDETNLEEEALVQQLRLLEAWGQLDLEPGWCRITYEGIDAIEQALRGGNRKTYDSEIPEYKWDVFICHAGEDKDDVARPLANELSHRGFAVWLDEHQLTLGDSLRRKIDQGLAGSRYGVVILSKAFFSKEWPQKELDGLTAREDGRQKVILPIWHGVSREDVARYAPTLADKYAVSTSIGSLAVADEVAKALARE